MVVPGATENSAVQQIHEEERVSNCVKEVRKVEKSV